MSNHYEIETSSSVKKYKHPILIDTDRNTRLHYAAANGKDEEVIQYLEKEHPMVDVENYLGWTPLMMACRKGNLSTSKILLDYRADASRKNKFGMNVFLICVAGGNFELVQLILEHLLVGGISKQFLEKFFSPLSVSIIFNNFDIFKFLIEKKFGLNKKTHLTEITPLMFAAAMENTKAYKMLLLKGADETLKNYLNHTCIDIVNIRKNMQKIEEQKLKKEEATTSQKEPNSALNQQDHLVPTTIRDLSQKINPTLSFLTLGSQRGSPQFVHISPNYVALPTNSRKSSNVSPFFMPSPNVTPITPFVAGGHQLFFPPDFSPATLNVSQIFDAYNFNNSDLNARLSSSAGIIMSPNLINVLSPCM